MKGRSESSGHLVDGMEYPTLNAFVAEYVQGCKNPIRSKIDKGKPVYLQPNAAKSLAGIPWPVDPMPTAELDAFCAGPGEDPGGDDSGSDYGGETMDISGADFGIDLSDDDGGEAAREGNPNAESETGPGDSAPPPPRSPRPSERGGRRRFEPEISCLSAFGLSASSFLLRSL